MDDFLGAFGGVWESVTEGAGDWLDKVIDTEIAEIGAQPETNEAKGQNVTFGDGKESPTVATTSQGMQPIISGVDNKTLAFGAVGLIALALIVKG